MKRLLRLSRGISEIVRVNRARANCNGGGSLIIAGFIRGQKRGAYLVGQAFYGLKQDQADIILKLSKLKKILNNTIFKT